MSTSSDMMALHTSDQIGAPKKDGANASLEGNERDSKEVSDEEIKSPQVGQHGDSPSKILGKRSRGLSLKESSGSLMGSF